MPQHIASTEEKTLQKQATLGHFEWHLPLLKEDKDGDGAPPESLSCSGH